MESLCKTLILQLNLGYLKICHECIGNLGYDLWGLKSWVDSVGLPIFTSNNFFCEACAYGKKT